MAWKMLPLVMMCSLSQTTVMLDLQTDKEVRFEKYQKVQIIQVKTSKTIVYRAGGYYEVDSDKLFCR